MEFNMRTNTDLEILKFIVLNCILNINLVLKTSGPIQARNVFNIVLLRYQY